MGVNGKGPASRHNSTGPTTNTRELQRSTAPGLRNPSPSPAPCEGAAERYRCPACRYLDLLLELAALVQEDRITGADMGAQRTLDTLETAALRALAHQETIAGRAQ